MLVVSLKGFGLFAGVAQASGQSPGLLAVMGRSPGRQTTRSFSNNPMAEQLRRGARSTLRVDRPEAVGDLPIANARSHFRDIDVTKRS
ncbi:hypothetical protein RFN28_32215 [Mesorhizobium sp. VK24D]|uniref:Uncharacterized protein n=1 Tax=Mesorhizobium album TaxID=3072314 RepID=A0ABU4Y9T5_9HYPH|nr:hypothetical protein [Mesorhizobium sp. VK24D]MDX8483083.1 hypothetical protein [Mesorhizobium sp. VK24D]